VDRRSDDGGWNGGGESNQRGETKAKEGKAREHGDEMTD